MTTNPIAQETSLTISKMMYSALSGNLNGAFDELNQTELTQEQKARIADILQQPRSTMQQSIVAIFAEKNITPIATSGDQSDSSQQPNSQPEMMDLFTTHNPAEGTPFAELNPLTKENNLSSSHFPTARISRVSKRKLSSENVDGTVENALGSRQKRLRVEYRGTDRAEPQATDQSAAQRLLATGHFIGNELESDIMERLFNSYLFETGFETLSAAACVNKYWNKCSTTFLDKLDSKDIMQVRPELTVLDAAAQGVQCEDEPKISKPRLLKWARELSPFVEGNAGVTQLTMTKGTTLNQLIEIAKGEGMTVDVEWGRIIDELGDVAVDQTYCILITNSVFWRTRGNPFIKIDTRIPRPLGRGGSVLHVLSLK